MNGTKRITGMALGALAFSAGVAATLCVASFGAAVAAPLFSMGDADEAGGGDWTAKDETTIKLRLNESDPIVLKLDDMRIGDTRTFKENGKDVTVTRDDKGFLVNVGGKEIRVPGELEGMGQGTRVIVMDDGKSGSGAARSFLFHSVDTDEKTDGDGKTFKKIVVHRGAPGAFAFRTGDARPVNAEKLLEKNELDALRGADSRTRETVAKALDELIAKGVILAPGCALPLLAAEGGDGVEVQVERKKVDVR